MLNRLKDLKNHKMAVTFSLVLLCVIAYMLRERYLALVLCFICINAIAVMGLDILFGYTGQVSFGHAAYYAIGAYGSTLLTINKGVPVLISILFGSVLAAIFGIIIAFPASKLVKHFLSLLTIAFGQMVYMFISVTDSLTNGYSGILNIPHINLFGFVLKSNQSNFVLLVILMAVGMIAKKRLVDSRIGRAFIAIRENPTAAGGMGINVRYYKVMAFAISAFFTGLAGALYAHLVGFISPDTFMGAQSNLFMTMLLFGGIGSLAGPIIGSAILVLVTEVMQAFASYQQLIYAVFILIVLFYLPNGMVGILANLKNMIVNDSVK